MNVHYFAYGSNMAPERLLARIGSARKRCIARLDGHMLNFHKIGSKDGSAKCDATRTGNAEHSVCGVVYEIAADELIALDQFEARGKGYERVLVSVLADSGELFQAHTYIATAIDARLRPYVWYKEHVLRGAIANALPAQYVAAIDRVLAEPDPDGERHAREMAIYG
jgi:cation transport regulator ChaC